MSANDSNSDWQLVSEENDTLESTDDSTSVHSESSIEVISMDIDDLETDTSYPSSQFSGSGSGAFFILRVPSSEADIATESDESDGVEVVPKRSRGHRQRNQTLTNSTAIADSSAVDSSEGDVEVNTEIHASPNKTESKSIQGFEEDHGNLDRLCFATPVSEQPNGDTPRVSERGEYGVDTVPEESLQNFLVVNVSENDSEPVVVGLNQIVSPDKAGDESADKSLEEQDENDQGVQEALQSDEFQNIVPQQEESLEVDQFMFLGVPQDDPDTESAPEMDDMDDRIESDQGDGHSEHSDDNSVLSNIDIGDLMADPKLIRQYVHRPNRRLNVTLNTVVVLVVATAIGLGVGHAIGSRRGKINNVFLKGCVDEYRNLFKDCSIKLKRSNNMEMKYNSLKEENTHLKQELDFQRSEVMRITNEAEIDIVNSNRLKTELHALRSEVTRRTAETQSDSEDSSKLKTEIQDLKSEVTRLTSKAQSVHIVKLQKLNQKLKEENNRFQNEIYDLRSEVAKLRYKDAPQPIAMKEVKRSVDQDSNILLKNKVNILEVKNQDLMREIGNLRYRPHPGNKEAETETQPSQQERRINEKNKKIDQLQEQLVVEQGRSNLWQSLYQKLQHQQKEEAKPQNTSSQDFISCISLLLQNVSTEDFSKVFVEEWSELKKMSAEKLRSVYDSITGSGSKEKANQRDEQQTRDVPTGGKAEQSTNQDGHQKKKTGTPKTERENKSESWTDKMKDVFNKTRISMSDVTQQIQATWKQVKNLSDDLWKKHEPTVSQIQKQVQDTVKQAASMFKEKIQEKSSKWFRKHKKNKHHKEHHDKHDTKKHRKDQEEHGNKKSTSYRASTSRRGYDDRKINREKRETQKEGKREERVKRGCYKNIKHIKKEMKVLDKIKKKMAKLNGCKYCKMDFDKKEVIFDHLDEFQYKFEISFLSDTDRWWLNCQWDWWWNSISVHLSGDVKIDPGCQLHLSPWQQEVVSSGAWSCSESYCKDRHGKKKRKHHKKKHHYRAYEDHAEKDNEKSVNLPKSSFYGKTYPSVHQGVKDSEFFGANDEPIHLFKSSFYGKASDPSVDEIQHNECNSTEATESCDPTTGECTTKPGESWYIKTMKHRQQQRSSEQEEAAKTEWMFERAKVRKDQRINSENCAHKAEDVYICA